MEFSQILSNLMLKKSISAYRLAKDIEVHQTTIKNWMDGKEPRIEQINKLADYFDVSTDYLLGKQQKNKPTVQNDGELTDPDIRRIQRARNNMNLEEKERMMNVLKANFDNYFSDDFEDEDTDE